MTEQHYVKCPNCDLEGVSHWGVGEAGSCAVCQGVGFVAVDGGEVVMSDRIHGIVWSEMRRLMVEPDGSNESLARADVQAVKATDRLLAALTASGYHITSVVPVDVPDATGERSLHPRNAVAMLLASQHDYPSPWHELDPQTREMFRERADAFLAAVSMEAGE